MRSATAGRCAARRRGQAHHPRGDHPVLQESAVCWGIDAGIDKIQLAVAKENKAESTAVNDKGRWTQSHNATATDATVESLMGMAPVLLGVLAVLSLLLPSLIVGGIAAAGTFFSPARRPQPALPGSSASCWRASCAASSVRSVVRRSVAVAFMAIRAGVAAVGPPAAVAGALAAAAAAAGAGWRQLRWRRRIGWLGRWWRQWRKQQNEAPPSRPRADHAAYSATSTASGQHGCAGKVIGMAERGSAGKFAWLSKRTGRLCMSKHISPRARALEWFSQLRVWDTEHNNGVLVYLLFAERDVEIVADRFNARVSAGPNGKHLPPHGSAVCRGEFGAGLNEGINLIGDLLREYFAADMGENEQPDRPVLV